MISFEGTYTKDEWMRGLSMAMRPSKRALWTRTLAMALFLVALGLILYPLLSGAGLDSFRLFRNAFAALVLGYWALAPFVSVRRLASRQWKAAGGEVSLKGTVTDEGIMTDASPQIDRWDSYSKAARGENMVVLLGSDGQATILPRRFFRDDRAWQDFQSLMDETVTEPK